MRRVVPPIERLMRNVVRDGTCWRVTKGIRKDGYCQIEVAGKKMLGHRLSYKHFVGPIPDGLDIDHVKARGCRFRSCINPAHLEPVTRPVNIRRGTAPERTRAYYDALWASRTHCDHGHDLAEVGLYIEERDGMTTRKCAGCRQASKSASRQRAMADPAKAARIREQNRRAVARYRAKKAA